MSQRLEKIYLEKMTPEKLLKLKKESNIFLIGIPKEIVLAGDREYIDSWADTIITTKEAKDCKFLLNITGYDSDSRELYEIPEVVDFIQQLFKRKSELYYYLEKQSKVWILLCHSYESIRNKNKSNSHVAVNVDRMVSFISSMHDVVQRSIRLSKIEKDKFSEEMMQILRNK